MPSSSSVYIFDLQLHYNLKELCIHRAPVRSMAPLSTHDGRETVATGGGLGDGQIIIWRHQSDSREAEGDTTV